MYFAGLYAGVESVARCRQIHFYLAAENGHDRWRRALVGDVNELEAGLLREQLRRQMAERPSAGRRVLDALRLSTGEGDEALEVGGRNAGMDNQHHRRRRDQRDWCEITDWIVAGILLDQRHEGARPVVAEDQCVAIRRRLRHGARGDRSRSAGTVSRSRAAPGPPTKAPGSSAPWYRPSRRVDKERQGESAGPEIPRAPRWRTATGSRPR